MTLPSGCVSEVRHQAARRVERAPPLDHCGERNPGIPESHLRIGDRTAAIPNPDYAEKPPFPGKRPSRMPGFRAQPVSKNPFLGIRDGLSGVFQQNQSVRVTPISVDPGNPSPPAMPKFTDAGAMVTFWVR